MAQRLSSLCAVPRSLELRYQYDKEDTDLWHPLRLFILYTNIPQKQVRECAKLREWFFIYHPYQKGSTGFCYCLPLYFERNIVSSFYS